MQAFLTCLRILLVLIPSAKPICNYVGLGISNLLSSGDEIQNNINMHLITDCGWKRLVRYLFVMHLLTKANWVDNTFHLIQFSLWDILKISSNSLIVSILVLLAISSIPIAFYHKSVLLSIFSAEVLDHVLLEVFRCLAQHLALSIIRMLRRLVWQVLNVLSFLRRRRLLFYCWLFTLISLRWLLRTVRRWAG